MTNKDIPQCSGASFYPHDTRNINNRYCGPQNPKASFLFNKVTWAVNQELIYDIEDAKLLIAYSALIALASSLVISIIMCLVPGLVLWLLSFATIGILIAFGVYLILEEYFPG